METANYHNSQVPPPLFRQNERGRGWFGPFMMSIVGPIIASFVMFILVLVVLAAVAGGQGNGKNPSDQAPQLSKTWSYGYGTTAVVRIDVKGVLTEAEEGGLFSQPGPVETALRQITAATEDPEIMAIILEVDSPGGGVTASDLIYKALQDFKASDPARKVIAVFGDIAASGGYYVAAGADWIVAHPTTLTGSFSVLISHLNVKKLGETYGIKLESIKSGANKDMLNPFTDLTDEQRVILQEVVDEMHERFVTLIADGRPELDAVDVAPLADGRVFSGPKALELKLVDQVGYWDDAVSKTCDLLNVEDIKVYRYSEEFGLKSLLKGAAAKRIPSLSLGELGRSRLLYMWQAW